MVYSRYIISTITVYIVCVTGAGWLACSDQKHIVIDW